MTKHPRFHILVLGESYTVCGIWHKAAPMLIPTQLKSRLTLIHLRKRNLCKRCRAKVEERYEHMEAIRSLGYAAGDRP